MQMVIRTGLLCVSVRAHPAERVESRSNEQWRGGGGGRAQKGVPCSVAGNWYEWQPGMTLHCGAGWMEGIP